MPEPSSSDRSAPPADLEPREASPLTRRDAVLNRLVDLVAQRALALRTSCNADSDQVDLAQLHEAVAALEGYRAALEFAKASAPPAETHSPPPNAVAPEPTTQTRSLEPELSHPAELEAAPESNGAAPAPGPGRGYPPFRDQITGLHSREGFDAVANGELKRCRRHGRVFSLVLLQLPGTDGDGLRRAANAVSAAIRDSDLAGRQVEGTLAVALPEAPPNEARIVAERIIRHCEGVGVWDEESRVGLVSHPAHGETLVHLLDAARAQLSLPAQRVLAALDHGQWPA